VRTPGAYAIVGAMPVVPALATTLLALAACGRIDFGVVGDAAVIGDGKLFAACAIDVDLGACYAFEGDVVDGTGHGNDGVASNISFGPGVQGSAVLTTTSSRIDVAASMWFAAAGITVEGWVRVDMLPTAAGRSVVFDNDQNYSMAIEDDGTVVCDFLGTQVRTVAALDLGVWTHVACAGDTSRVAAYIAGSLANATAPGPAMALGSGPVAIATNAPASDPRDWLVGAVDTLRVWRVVLADSQICQAAGTC
jgi:hypothetical protein